MTATLWQRTTVQKQDGTPPLTLEQRQQARQLSQLWGDFTDTMYTLMEKCASDPAAAPALLTSIEQFHSQAKAALKSLGLIDKAAASLALLTEVTRGVSKARTVMPDQQRRWLTAALRTLQDVVEEVVPKATTLEKGASRGAGVEAMEKLMSMAAEVVKKGQAPTPAEGLRQVLSTPEGQALRQTYYNQNPHLTRG